MTREEAKELLPIIQAFAEGKMIQDKIEGLTDWCDTLNVIQCLNSNGVHTVDTIG